MSKNLEVASLSTLSAAAAYMAAQDVDARIAALSATLATVTDAKEQAGEAGVSLWDACRDLARIAEESTGDDMSPAALAYVLGHVFAVSGLLDAVSVEMREQAAKSIKSYVSTAGKLAVWLRNEGADWSEVVDLSYSDTRALWVAANPFAEVSKAAATAIRYIGKAGNGSHQEDARHMVQQLQALAARIKAEKKAKGKAGSIASSAPAMPAEPTQLVVNG